MHEAFSSTAATTLRPNYCYRRSRRLASISSVTITRQAALSHSSRSLAPTNLFFGFIRLRILLTVESLTLAPAMRLRNSRCCGRVALPVALGGLFEGAS